MNITLRPWTVGDAPAYLEMMAGADFSFEDEELRCDDVREARRVLERQCWQELYNGDFYRAVLLDGQVVGNVQAVRQGGVWSHDGHVGCLLVREACGRGIGTEALRQMVATAFARRDYHRLTALVYSPNRASVRMVEKVGFTLEATLRHAVCKDGQYMDTLVYGLLRERTGIPTTLCCDPEDELSPAEQAALEPTMVSHPPTPLEGGRWGM